MEFYSEVSPGEAMYTSAMLPTTEYSNGAIRLTGTVALLGMVHEKETQEEAIKVGRRLDILCGGTWRREVRKEMRVEQEVG